MADERSFIQAIVDDYDELGFGHKIDDVTLESKDGENRVVLSPVFKGNVETGVELVSNGTLIFSGGYKDSGFTTTFAQILTSEMNV